MRQWFGDKLKELGLNLLVLLLFLTVLFNWSPFWLDHPGAALARGLYQSWWMIMLPAVLVVVKVRLSTIGRVRVHCATDAHGWPTVTWSEPRFNAAAILFKAYRVKARCDLREAADGGMLFCYQVLDRHDFERRNDCIHVPLVSVLGFSMTTAGELYRSADQRTVSDGHHIVLRAELDPWQPNAPAFVPLTFTAASKAEVETLHRALSLAFAPGGLAARLAAARSHEATPDSEAASPIHGDVPLML